MRGDPAAVRLDRPGGPGVIHITPHARIGSLAAPWWSQRVVVGPPPEGRNEFMTRRLETALLATAVLAVAAALALTSVTVGVAALLP